MTTQHLLRRGPSGKYFPTLPVPTDRKSMRAYVAEAKVADRANEVKQDFEDRFDQLKIKDEVDGLDSFPGVGAVVHNKEEGESHKTRETGAIQFDPESGEVSSMVAEESSVSTSGGFGKSRHFDFHATEEGAEYSLTRKSWSKDGSFVGTSTLNETSEGVIFQER